VTHGVAPRSAALLSFGLPPQDLLPPDALLLGDDALFAGDGCEPQAGKLCTLKATDGELQQF
jgi:hypothetical protein